MSPDATRPAPRGPSPLRRPRCGALLAAIALLTAGTARASPVVDAINPGAEPAFANGTYTSYGFRDVGWYYTPSATYDLDGVSSRFLGMREFAVTPQKTLTVRVLTDRPAAGGGVLRQADFTVRVADGGVAVGSFAPLRLDAGTRYFVALLDVQDVGINLGTWANDASGDPRPAGGATVNLGGLYFNAAGAGSPTYFSRAGGPYGVSSNGLVNVAGGEPILFFAGTPVPEPAAALVLLGCGVPLVLCRRGRPRVHAGGGGVRPVRPACRPFTPGV